MPPEAPLPSASEKPTAWITGVTGYWGRNVALCLLRQGWRVVGLSRSQPQELQSWAEAQGESLQWHPCDLAAPDWDPPTGSLQAIFHCAALFHPDLALMMRVNALGPIRLAGSPIALSLVFPPRAPSGLQAQLASQLSRPPKIRNRLQADSLVRGVLAGKRRVGRWPWLAGVSTLLW